MSTEVVPGQAPETALALPQPKYADEASFLAVSSGGGFLPRVMLMNSSSNAVKEGLINQGHYALVQGKDNRDLTKEVIVKPVTWRPRAMEINDNEIISAFNPKSAEFKRIQEKSDESDSGCMFGPEFLVWVPSVKVFATFFMASKTARRVAPEMREILNRNAAATLKSTLIKGKKYSWFGPVVTICSQPIEPFDPEELRELAEKFANPPETESEPAEPESRPR